MADIRYLVICELPRCDLKTTFGDIDLSRHWVGYPLDAWQPVASTWNNVDLPSKGFRGMHPSAISWDVLMNLIRNMCSEITLLIITTSTGANAWKYDLC